jgi:hypothetical protein
VTASDNVRTFRKEENSVRTRIRAASLLVAVLSAACSSDYTALRDWSQQAREAVLPTDVPRAAQVPMQTEARRPVGSRQDAVLVLQEAAAGWLAALASMADDAPPPSDGSMLRERAARVAAFDPQGAAAVVSIGDAIDYVAARRWGADELPYAVDFADVSFQAVMAALARQMDAIAAAQDVQEEQSGGGSRSVPARALVTRIAEGHALLKQRDRILAQSDTSRMLRAEASELRRLMAVATAGRPPAGGAQAGAQTE